MATLALTLEFSFRLEYCAYIFNKLQEMIHSITCNTIVQLKVRLRGRINNKKSSYDFLTMGSLFVCTCMPHKVFQLYYPCLTKVKFKIQVQVTLQKHLSHWFLSIIVLIYSHWNCHINMQLNYALICTVKNISFLEECLSINIFWFQLFD